MGPPTATLNSGQFKTDFTYHYSENDINLRDVDLAGAGIGYIVFDELNINRYYGTAAYGLTDRWEAYGKLGGGSIESSSPAFAYGWGTRVTLIDGDRVDWGLGFLMSWLDDVEDDDSHLVCIAGQPHEGRYSFDVREIQAMAGPTIWFDGWKLYGGVFYYDLDGDFDATVTGPLLVTPLRISGDIDEEDHIGGYIGAVIGSVTGLEAMIETAFLGGSWAVGGSLGWRF
jgi:hypothetical protein